MMNGAKVDADSSANAQRVANDSGRGSRDEHDAAGASSSTAFPVKIDSRSASSAKFTASLGMVSQKARSG